MDCEIHGTVEADNHHIQPKYLGGDSKPGNIRRICRHCHRELHRHDIEIHRRGWNGLVAKLQAEGKSVSQYMAELQQRHVETQKQKGEAYGERMSRMAKARWRKYRLDELTRMGQAMGGYGANPSDRQPLLE